MSGPPESVEAAPSALSRLWQMPAAEFLFASPVYPFTLAGRVPARLKRLPPEPWRGDLARGGAMLAGRFACAGQAIKIDRPDWFSRQAHPAVLGDLHAFDWLDDLAAVNNEPAKAKARELIADWLVRAKRWHAIAWAPDVAARRIAAWLSHARFIARGRNDELGQRILASLVRQAIHLARTAGLAAPGAPRLVALKGLVYAGLCGIGGERRALRALDAAWSESERELLDDGGIATRSPSDQARALAALLDMRDMLSIARQPVPDWLEATIPAVAAMLAYCCHGDGALALFHGGNEEDPAWLASLASRAGSVPMASAAPSWGYERLNAGDMTMIMDVGAPPAPGRDLHAHAGTLSFEASFGGERLIVNCGAYPAAETAWETAQRSTAAHSTVSVDDASSSTYAPGTGLGRRPVEVHRRREESDGNIWLEAAHDGYQESFGLVHHRRLFLAARGDDLRGEDIVEGAHRGMFAVRFHLHPNVQASIIQNGAAVLLRLRSGAAWRLQIGGGRLDIAESVYLGRRGEMWRNEQIVVTAPLDGAGGALKWALKRFSQN